MNKVVLLSFVCLFLAPFSAHAAGFDCKKAQAKIEHYICDNPVLSQLDGTMAKAYQRLRQALPKTEQQALKMAQRRWLKQRNTLCVSASALEKCEGMYQQRNAELIEHFHASTGANTRGNTELLSDLLKDMAYPDPKRLDTLSKDALNNENYVPWPRKEILRLSSRHVQRLTAGYLNKEVYVYYLRVYQEVDWVYEIVEYNVTRNTSYLVTQGPENLVSRSSAFDLYQGKLYYSLSSDDAQQVYQYSPGSNMAPREITSAEYQDIKTGLSRANYALSANGRFILVEGGDQGYTGEYNQDVFGNREEMHAFYQAHPERLKPWPNFVVFDRHQEQGREIVLDQTINESWNINDVAMHPSKPLLYFDNHGGMACIWEYDFMAGKMSKIVPEHEARKPASFSIDSQDFILFALRDKAYPKQIGIYLAARPQ